MRTVAMPLALVALLVFACSTAQSSNPVAGSAAPEESPPMAVAEAAAPVEDAQKSEPVLVELFTSQGCSSCPPADELLRVINERTDVEVIALSFHVDYWDYIGWRDPFSSRAATKRQQAYAAQISQGRAYTPQLVVDGRAHVVGSNRSDAFAAIEKASARPSSGLRLNARLLGVKDGKLQVDLKAVGSLKGKRLLLAVYESGLMTKVVRGENAGRKIRNDYVVRQLTTVKTGVSSLSLDPSWNTKNLGIVAFAQDKQTLRIEAALREAL